MHASVAVGYLAQRLSVVIGAQDQARLTFCRMSPNDPPSIYSRTIAICTTGGCCTRKVNIYLSSKNTKRSHCGINAAVCRLPVHSQTHGKLQQSPPVPQHVVRHTELSRHSSSGVACPTGHSTKSVCCSAQQKHCLYSTSCSKRSAAAMVPSQTH